jgi:hypothetical protein
MRRTVKVGLALAGSALGILPGCFFDDMSDCNYNISLACYWNNQGGSGGTGGSPPGCMPSDTNKDIDGTCGAFVSPAGSDANGKGTKEAPYLTLGKAVQMNARVYACANADKPFDEALAPLADVVIYGGLDCANGWVYDPSKKSAWTAPKDSVPLSVTGSVNVEVYDFAITARDAGTAGGSSIGVLAAGDKAEMKLERCDVVAGAGKDGVTPAKPEGSGTPGENGKPGADGCVDLLDPKGGGQAGKNMCDAMSYEGGPGGAGTTASGGPGGDGQPQPGGTAPNDGLGGDAQIGNKQCTAGHGGAQGQEGEPGLGAVGLGTLLATGYQGTTSGDGKPNGTSGQGGGGGGGAKICAKMGYAGPGGGGGGAGGCPGTQPGKGGGPGGASIGLVSVGASVFLSEVIITTNNGGAGGTGGNGQSGGKGGTAGQAGKDGGDADAKACGGGDGGRGGDAGPGGGGLGGHSIGIAFTGTAPATTKVVLNPGVAGPGGVAGAMNMSPGTKGDDGQACPTLNFDDGTCK